MRSYVIALVAFLIAVTACMVGLNSYRSDMYMASRKEVYDVAKSYTNAIEEAMNEPEKSVSGMVSIARLNPANMMWLEKKSSEVMAKNDNIIGVVYRREGNEALIQSHPQGFSVTAQPDFTAAYDHVVSDMGDTEGRPQTIGPVKLVDGRMTAVTIAPIYAYNAHTQGFDRLGTISVISELPKAIETANISLLSAQKYDYALYGNNDLLDDGGLIMSSGEELPQNAESSTAVVSQGLWVLKVYPVGGFNKFISTEVAVVISLVAGFAAAFVAFRTVK